MGKLSAGFDLGCMLKARRKAAGFTQAKLATQAGLAERTGRNLPGGETTGRRLATLRRRRGLSQEALAASGGVNEISCKQ